MSVKALVVNSKVGISNMQGVVDQNIFSQKKTRSMQNNQNLEKKTQEMHPSKREEKEHKERYFFRSYIFEMQDIEDHIDV